MDNTLIKIKDLFVEYKSKKGILGDTEVIHAVNNLSLDIYKGEVLAVAGESGCGKSTLAKAIIKLVPAKSGEIIFDDKNILNTTDLQNFRKKVQIIFQNPYASLDPKVKIFDTLKEPLKINTKLNDTEIKEKIYDILAKVGLDRECLNLYPHEFSGGQRQRIAIARALVLEPEFVVADEPVSALDVSIQAQIINLLLELKNNYNLTLMFISHDLSVIKHIADRVAVMYLGELVELGTKEEIFNDCKHPYTKILLNSAPQIGNEISKSEVIKSDLPSPSNLPKGCKFHTRCPYCMSICKEQEPEITDITQTHKVKCFLHK